MCNNRKLDLVNIFADTHIKFGENVSICSQDIEQKQNYDGQTEGRTNRRTNKMTDNPNPI